MSKICVATTVLEPEVLLKPFIVYHRTIGFDRLYLFFDNPNDKSIDEIQGERDVTIIRCDELLRRTQFREARSFAAAGSQAPLGIYPNVIGQNVAGQSGVMMRQQLNLVTAQKLAARDGQEWLVSLDIDELFYCEQMSVASHFKKLSGSDRVAVTYCNHEAVPESLEINNPFLDVDLFRINPRVIQEAKNSGAAMYTHNCEFYFRSYTIGKSAVRILDNPVPPLGCHRYQIDADSSRLDFIDPCILHYSECGFTRFWRKYEILGKFDDKYYDRFPIEKWKLQSRDLRLSGNEARARIVYETQVVANADETDDLIKLGVFKRFHRPSQILRSA